MLFRSAHFPFPPSPPPPHTFFFLFLTKTYNLAAYLLLPLSSFLSFPYFIIIIVINTTHRISTFKLKKKRKKFLRRKFNVAPLQIYTINLSPNRIICGSNTKWFFSFSFFFPTPTHLDKRCQVSKEWHVRLPISRSRKMRWEVILFPSGTSKGRERWEEMARDQLIAIVSRHKPTWFTIRASTRNLRRTSTFQFIFIATQTSYRVHIGRHGAANVSRESNVTLMETVGSSFFSFFLFPFPFFSLFFLFRTGREGEKMGADRAVSFKWQDEASYNVINRWGGRGRNEVEGNKKVIELSLIYRRRMDGETRASGERVERRNILS